MTTATLSTRLPPATHAASARLVRLWLFAIAAMVLAMVVVGGATRLTESGLSITEWQPLLGILPPLTDAAWERAFAAYRQIPQYVQYNQDMTLSGFKFIYWWEWSHRLLGRAIGVVFLVPFVSFVWSGAIARREIPGFLGLFVLGGLQGFIGWWMVKSGLADRTEVAPYRLATHLVLAAIIFAVAIWMAQRRSVRPLETAPPGTRLGAGLVILLILGQIFLGALVAGNDAGQVYNTWPLMDGAILPGEAFGMTPLWVNFFENHALVQFMHRMGAYVVAIAVLVHGFRIAALGQCDVLRVTALLMILAVVAQLGLGIATLVLQVPLELALLHQAMAIVLFGFAIAHRARMA